MRKIIPTRQAYQDWAEIYDSNANRTRDLDALVLRSCNEFMARGHNHLHSLTRKTNAPSLKLQARLGWEIYDEGNIWASPESA